ncbi:hypothetical protein ACROYT_G020054 [Oculina patagonica]
MEHMVNTKAAQVTDALGTFAKCSRNYNRSELWSRERLLATLTPLSCLATFAGCLYTYCLLKRQRRKNRRRRHSFIHSRPSQRPACNTSHARVSGAGCLPNTRERQPTTANPLETLTVRLPPLHSGEQPSLPFNVEETPSPYSREEPPPPYSGEGPSSSPSREEPPPPYSGEEPLSQYAETSLV